MNCFFVRDLRAPFGGASDSGVGREGGVYSRRKSDVCRRRVKPYNRLRGSARAVRTASYPTTSQAGKLSLDVWMRCTGPDERSRAYVGYGSSRKSASNNGHPRFDGSVGRTSGRAGSLTCHGEDTNAVATLASQEASPVRSGGSTSPPGTVGGTFTFVRRPAFFAANRDEGRFPGPDVLDIERPAAAISRSDTASTLASPASKPKSLSRRC